MKNKIHKKWLKIQEGESYLFSFFKGDKDCSVHVWLAENVKAKGLVYRNSALTEVDYVFTERSFDFDYKGFQNIQRFYIAINFEEGVEMNVCFKTELSEPAFKIEKHKDIKEKNKKAVNKMFKDDPDYNKKLLKSLRRFSNRNRRKLREMGALEPPSGYNIINRNKRAVSSYKDNKRAQSAYIAQRTERRIQSAQITKLVREKDRFDMINHKIHKRDLKILAGAFQKKIRLFLEGQKAWVIKIYFGRVVRKITDLYMAKTKEIKEIEEKAMAIKGDKTKYYQIKDIFKM